MINIDELRASVAQRTARGELRTMLERRHPYDAGWTAAQRAEHTAWLDRTAQEMVERPAKDAARNAESAAAKAKARQADADDMAALEADLRQQAGGGSLAPVIRAELAALDRRVNLLKRIAARQR